MKIKFLCTNCTKELTYDENNLICNNCNSSPAIIENNIIVYKGCEQKTDFFEYCVQIWVKKGFSGPTGSTAPRMGSYG